MIATDVPAVLVVCTGNLCRSPLVAALLERELDRTSVKASVSSAGTAAPFMSTPDKRLLRTAGEHGLDLSAHRSRALSPAMLDDADLVLVMTAEHRRQIEALSATAASRTVLLRAAAWKAQLMRGGELPFTQWVERLTADVPVAERPRLDLTNDIPDPIGGPLREYRAMAEEVSALVATLAARWSGR
jgi:protein-tyrosine phosphatase